MWKQLFQYARVRQGDKAMRLCQLGFSRRRVLIGASLTCALTIVGATYAGAVGVPAAGSPVSLTQEVTLDVSGRTPVDISGNWAIAGNTEWRNGRGNAHMLQYTDDKWRIAGTISASDGHKEDNFGFAVAMDGSTAVVGAPFASVDTGKAYVFELLNGKWQQTAELQASDGAHEDRFGASVGISGDTIVIGAPCDAEYPTCSPDAAYVFVKPASGWSGTLTETTKLVEVNSYYRDKYAYAVSISGNTIVVGGPQAPSTETSAGPGVADIFVEPPTGWGSQPHWNPTAALIEPDATSGDHFGHAVDISDSTVAIGAPPNDVYVYEAPPSGWSGSIYPAAVLLPASGVDSGGVGSWVATTGAKVGTGSNSVYLFDEPPGGWNGRLLPTVDFVDMNQLSGALSSSTMMTGGSGANFTMPFYLSVALSAPATVPQYGEFTTQVFVTNSSATATLPVQLFMNAPYQVSIVGAAATLGTCNAIALPYQAECTLPPIAGNGGEGIVSVKMRVNDGFFPANNPIQQDAFLPYAMPTLQADGKTTVVFTPLSADGFNDIAVSSGHTGTETFAISDATGAEPISVHVMSFNAGLLPDANIEGASACVSTGTCHLTVRPVAEHTGKAGVRVEVEDAYGASAVGEFEVTVTSASGGGAGGGGAMLTGLPILVLLAALALLGKRRRGASFVRSGRKSTMKKVRSELRQRATKTIRRSGSDAVLH